MIISKPILEHVQCSFYQLNIFNLQQIDMEKDYYHSRLDKAKEQLIASRREESRQNENKKKKKHKDERRSHSRSRSDKKKRSRSRDKDRQVERKHKKQHKHHKEVREKSRQRENKRDDDRHRERERERDSERRDRDFERRDRGRDNRDRGNGNSRGDHYANRRRQDNPQQKDPYFDQRRQIQKIRKSNVEKAEQMDAQLEKQMILDKKQKQIEQARQKFKEAQKQMEEAKRQDHTILVYCLPLKAKEKDIWNFFSKTNCGKIRDIRIIRDARSGRSKGVAYVEFYTSDAVQKALTMTDRPFELKNRQFMGLRVQHSQAEKNRAAAAAKQMRVIKPADPIEQQQEIIRRQTKVLVGGLVGKLQQIQQGQLKQLFQPFGEIQYVDIHRDPQTGMCKGFAFIQYVDTQKAKLAVKAMNNLKIGQQNITVQIMNVAQRGEVSAHDQFLYNPGSKANLMNKLSHGTGPSHSNLMRPPISTVTTPYLIMTNMFKMEGTTPAFFQEMKKEIQIRCDEFGTVQRIFIEKNNQGNVWIKYSDTASAYKAQERLNGKFFDNTKIFCYFVTENTYQLRVGI